MRKTYKAARALARIARYFLLSYAKGTHLRMPIYHCLCHYWRTKGKKSIFRQIREFSALTRYWEEFPNPYFEYTMFTRSCPLGLSEMKNFIPQSAFDRNMQRFIGYKSIIDDKALFSDLCQTYGIPHPKVIVKYSGGVFFNSVNEILSNGEVDEAIRNCNYSRLFLKDSQGAEGFNIHAFDAAEEGGYYEGATKLTAAYIAKNYQQNKMIIQEGLIQDGQLAELNYSCLNTFRVLSKYKAGKAEIIAAMLKIGASGKVVDNVSQGALTIDIDIETGQLSDYGKNPYDVNEYRYLPGTTTEFAGMKIRGWGEVKNLVLRSALAFHELGFVGWDVALLEKGAVIIEGNFNVDIIVHQFFGKGIADQVLGT